MPWEGVAAQRAGVELNVFKLGDYGIPYCYRYSVVFCYVAGILLFSTVLILTCYRMYFSSPTLLLQPSVSSTPKDPGLRP
jgi:hypothetical protein